MVKVFIIESEKGWGQKIEDTEEFPTREKAENFCRAYNKKHCPPKKITPDWYMYARLEDQEGYFMLR